MICLILCSIFFFFNDTATTEIYTLSLHDALPILVLLEILLLLEIGALLHSGKDLRRYLPEIIEYFDYILSQYRCKIVRSEEHTSEFQSRQYLVCRLLLEKKKKIKQISHSILAYVL